MINILFFNQPVLDYTLQNLKYTTILNLQKVVNLEESFYKNEIEIIAKGELITFIKTTFDTVYTIKKFDNLDYMSLSHYALTSLHDSIGILTNLTQLMCHHNKLKSLPESIGFLINLTHLFISNNELTSLPESIGKLINLTNLSCHYNKLTSLSSIENLINLNTLYCRNNKLKSLPESITNLNKLNIDDRDLKHQN